MCSCFLQIQGYVSVCKQHVELPNFKQHICFGLELKIKETIGNLFDRHLKTMQKRILLREFPSNLDKCSIVIHLNLNF